MKNLKFIDQIIKETNDILKKYKDTEKQVIKNLIWNYQDFIKENIKCKNCVLFKKRTFSDYQLSKDNIKKYSEETKKERKSQFEKLINGAENKLTNLKSNLWNTRAKENDESDVIEVLDTLKNFYQEFSEKLKPNIDGTLYENKKNTMNLNKKIGYLLDSGLTPNFISSINESTIDTLYNRLVETKKKETKEQTTGVTTKITTEKVTSIDQSVLNTPQGVNVDGINLQNQGGKLVARQIKETELTEKFESKAQQGLFWAKCNKCKTDDCKWCKMAKEFSKNTSKKQYEKMPEKKHPEKTVKYKKNTNEEFTMANYFDKVASAYTNTMKGKLTKEEIIKKQIDKIVETNLEPTMKKKELIKLIESQFKNKRNINEDFYFDREMEEAVTELDIPTYEPITTFDTDVDYEKKKEKSKVAKVEDCENEGNFFYIKPRKSTSLGDVYMITDGGSDYCVQVIKMVNSEPDDYRITETYNECNNCIIDLKLSKKSNKGKYELEKSVDSPKGKSGYQELPRIGSDFDTSPKEALGPMARGNEELSNNLREEFNRILKKINRNK